MAHMDALRLLVSLALATAVCACDVNSNVRVVRALNMDKVEAAARQWLEGPKVGAKLESVKCPDKVVIVKGKHFNCVAKLRSGMEFTLDVEMTDEKGDVHLNTKDQLLFAVTLEKRIRDAFAEDGAGLDASCGDRVQSGEVGRAFQCHLTAPGQPQLGVIDVKITGAQNTSSWKLRGNLTPLGKLASDMADEFARPDGSKPKVDCGKGFAVLQVGESVACKVEDMGMVRVKLRDAEGNVDFLVRTQK